MPKWFFPLMILAVLALVGGVAGLVYVSSLRVGADTPAIDDPFAQAPGLDVLEVLDFRMVDQNGTLVDPSIFDDQITVLSFFFTNCVLVCPEMTGEMYTVERELKDLPIRFVSISVDPEHDTLERIAEYASNYGAEPPRWRFLTGDKETVDRMVREGMHFELQADENEENLITLGDGSTMSNIIHPTQFFVIGPDRRVLGLYSYLYDTQLEELVARLRAMVD